MRPSLAVVCLSAVLVIGGCPGVELSIDGNGLSIPGFNRVTIELVNDTDFDVDPFIRFDDDNSWAAALFPADDLSTGLLAPGDALQFSFDCDELGLVFSDEAQQLDLLGVIAQADASDVLKRGDEYDCGDLIRFRFVGNFEMFGVVVSVNNAVVD